MSVWYTGQVGWGEEYIRVWGCLADFENAIDTALAMGTISRVVGQWYQDNWLFSE